MAAKDRLGAWWGTVRYTRSTMVAAVAPPSLTESLHAWPQRLQARLFAPVDIASIVVFRILFGAIMVWEVLRFFDGTWIRRHYIDPDFHFTYLGFGWVRPWPGDGMYWHFAVMALLAACIAAGFLYRASAALFFLAFAYVSLLDQARYLNHFYLVSLVSLLMIAVPAHRAVSVDARLRPALRADTVPAWCLWLLRAQIGLVYFYGGVAKLNADWLRGQPMRMWLSERGDDPILGSVLAQPWCALLFSYGGLLLDLLIVPLLLWRRTRVAALAAAIVFHLLNARMFSIGIFPWFMIAATLLFLPPDWPRKLLGRPPPSPAPAEMPRAPRLTLGLLGLYLAVQVLVPLRHWLYPGVVHWTEEGHRFSWHMKLRDKSSRTLFFATDPLTGRSWEIKQSKYLTANQVREMESTPDMILQFAHHVAADLRREGYERIEIRADARVSLNGRPRELLIDPKVDLASQPRNLLASSWILPLQEPVPGS